MKYRVRMASLKWYVRTYDADGKHVEDIGPFDSFKSAEAYAVGKGYSDWDKGE